MEGITEKKKRETKGCYAKVVRGKYCSKAWLKNCKKRWKKHLCCRNCEEMIGCRYRCNRALRECPYYLDRNEVATNKLAYEVDPFSKHWQKGAFPYKPVH